MAYMGGRWRLGPDEALCVTVRPPSREFVYWGLVILNPWMESYEARGTVTATNDARASREPDGSWRVLIAPRDPGVPNWLDTGGRREGFALLRWVGAGSAPPAPLCEVVPLGAPRPRRSG
jgi:hypothetical protein